MKILLLTIILIAGFIHPPNVFAKTIKLPWSLINVWWDTSTKEEFKSLEIDFEILSNISRNKAEVFIAPLGSFYLNKQTLYGGVQLYTSGYKNKYEHSYSKRISIPQNGGIFSRWGERSPKAIRMAKGGLAESAGYEGNFISVRNSIPWRKGRYTYKIFTTGKTKIHGKIHTWVKAVVIDRRKRKTYEIGSLAFPGRTLKVTGSVSNFVELYGRKIDTANIPHYKFNFYWPKLNGRELKAEVWSGHQLQFPVYAKGRARKRGSKKYVEVEIGHHFGKKGLMKGQLYWWEYLYK